MVAKLHRITKMRDLVVFTVLLSATVIYGDDPLCHSQLIKTLPDSQLSSSSDRAGAGLTTAPPRGRLNTTEVKASNGTTLEGAWSPAASGQNTYLQAMFNDVTMIDTIMTQGRNQGNEWVKMYGVQYTEDGTTWKTLMNPALGVEEIVPGNSDSDGIQESKLSCPIFAKGIRIVPKDWQGNIALRFDVKGCNLDDTASAVTSPTSPFLPGIVTPMGSTTTTTILTTPTTVTTTTTKTTTTTRPTTTSTTTAATTTTPYVFHPGIPGNLLPVTGYTTRSPFMPGIQTPFGPVPLIG